MEKLKKIFEKYGLKRDFSNVENFHEQITSLETNIRMGWQPKEDLKSNLLTIAFGYHQETSVLDKGKLLKHWDEKQMNIHSQDAKIEMIHVKIWEGSKTTHFYCDMSEIERLVKEKMQAVSEGDQVDDELRLRMVFTPNKEIEEEMKEEVRKQLLKYIEVLVHSPVLSELVEGVYQEMMVIYREKEKKQRERRSVLFGDPKKNL